MYDLAKVGRNLTGNLLVNCEQNLYGKHLLSARVEIVLTHVNCLFLLYSLLVGTLRLSGPGRPLLISQRVCSVAPLFVELGACAIVPLLFDDEIWRAVQIGIGSSGWIQSCRRVIHVVSIHKSVRVLTDI